MEKTYKQRWQESLGKLKNVNFWNDTELPSNKYTAMASYSEVINGIITNKGKCMNIDSTDTISNYICCKSIAKLISKITSSKLIYSILFFNMIGIFCILYILFDYSYKSLSYLGSLFWIAIPVILLLDSNITILRRIWCRSFKPWYHLYSSLLETIAFCDICGWDFRAVIIFPAMLFNQINIINSDAVYFKLKIKIIPLLQIFLSIIWKLFIIYCLRLGYFKNIYPRNIIELSDESNTTMINYNSTILYTNKTEIFYLNNVSLFFTKSMSLFLILCGQAYFKLRYNHKLYFLHTHYTIKKNKEWNIMNRNQRIHKKQSLNLQVNDFKDQIKNEFTSIQHVSI